MTSNHQSCQSDTEISVIDHNQSNLDNRSGQNRDMNRTSDSKDSKDFNVLLKKDPFNVYEHILEDAIDFPRKKSRGVDTTEVDDDIKKDTLGASIWRLYTKAKDSLPQGIRVENITWRMMAVALRKNKVNIGSRNKTNSPTQSNNNSPRPTISSTTPAPASVNEFENVSVNRSPAASSKTSLKLSETVITNNRSAKYVCIVHSLLLLILIRMIV